jgi:hypothetical protein
MVRLHMTWCGIQKVIPAAADLLEQVLGLVDAAELGRPQLRAVVRLQQLTDAGEEGGGRWLTSANVEDYQMSDDHNHDKDNDNDDHDNTRAEAVADASDDACPQGTGSGFLREGACTPPASPRP